MCLRSLLADVRHKSHQGFTKLLILIASSGCRDDLLPQLWPQRGTLKEPPTLDDPLKPSNFVELLHLRSKVQVIGHELFATLSSERFEEVVKSAENPHML